MSSRYAETKPYALPASLDTLSGPTVGMARLPRHIDWGPAYAYDLADEADLLLMYERVIREAQTPEDLHAHLNARVLHRVHRVWSALFLLAPERTTWDNHFPDLRTPSTSTACSTSGTHALKHSRT
jgi:hypothetical protein